MSNTKPVANMVVIARLCLLLFGMALLVSPTRNEAAAQSNPPPDPRFGAIGAYESPELAAESNVGWERITFDWSLMQPGPDVVLDNSSLNEEWFTAARTSGREVVGMLVNTPSWTTEGRPNVGVPSGLYLPVSDPGNLWANFVREVVSAYQRRGINDWIIWHNPNIPSGVYGPGWEGSTQDYYQMLKVAYIVAKQSNGEAQIHLASYSLAYDTQWLSRLVDLMVEDPTAADNDYYFDVASISLHYDTEKVFTDAQQSFFVMQQNDIFKDLWIVESGAYPPDIALTEYPDVTADQQASFIIQSFALGLGAGAQRVAVDRFADSLSDEGDLQPGLVGPVNDPHAAYNAYRVVTENFAGAVEAFHNPFQFELVDYVRFKHSDRVTHIAWARSEQPALLSIPARGDEAILIDQADNRQTLQPQDGRYSIRLEGANCNGQDGSCPIGGPVKVLVETGLDPLNQSNPSAQILSDIAPTLNPDQLTPTPQPTAISSITPTPAATAAAASTDTAPVDDSGAAPVEQQDDDAPSPTASVATQEPPPPSGPTPIPQPASGAAAVAPFVLVGLGTLIIGGALGFWLRDRRQQQEVSSSADESADRDSTDNDNNETIEEE